MNANVIPRTSHDSTAYYALKIGFIAAPIIAGIDKFFNALTDWTDYLAPVANELLNVSPEQFMMGVGVIEIIAGIGVLLKPKVFAFVVSAWLVAIICNLFLLGAYYDVALRDLGLAIGAFALGEMALTHERTKETSVLERKTPISRENTMVHS